MHAPLTRREARPSATTIRSQLVLEMAAGLSAEPDQPLRQVKVSLRRQGSDEWPVTLLSSSTHEGLDAVVAREAALATLNPAAALTLAYRGTGSYASPQPVRALCVIPSLDQYVFAVRSDLGLRTLEDIPARRPALRIALRGQADHYLHVMLAHVAEAAGFSLADVEAWGGTLRREENGPPKAGGAKLAAVARGEIDAIFDEGAHGWVDAALDAGMTILSVGEPTLAALERMGYRRAVLPRARYPRLPADVATLDFSGWIVFVRADAPDALVRGMCAALDERKALIPWEGEGPLPIERMCRDAPETPLDVPLHPAAERYWEERGYLITRSGGDSR